MDEKVRRGVENPLAKASFVSKLFVNFISPLMATGAKRPLTQDDLFDVLDHERAEYLTDQLEV